MIAWLQRNRTSVRFAFMIGLFSRIISVGLSLFWSRLLLRAMGDPLNGLFVTFQGITRLGGLGDFGMGGAVGLRAGQMLGEADASRLQKFLANARSVFLILGLAVLTLLLALAPWLPGWLRFENVLNAGSFPLLFAAGALGAGLLLINIYFSNLNYAHGTVVWPVLPALVLAQLSLAGHWMLARAQAPLWVQYLPYLAVSVLSLLIAKKMLDWSHPWLGNLTPLRCDWPEWKFLFASSGWVYLCSLGSLIFTTTDRVLINAVFGSAVIPKYYYNYKLCELAVIVVGTASSVSMPKINQWLAGKSAADKTRAVSEINRLNQFQVVLGCAAALVYLLVNDWFVNLWLGGDYHAPFAWQAAFALNLAVMAGGDTGIQVAGRCGVNGIRAAGMAIGAAGVLNLLLAIIAAKFHSITGIASATVVAQSCLNLALGGYVCRHIGLSAIRWAMRSLMIPLLIVLAGAWLKTIFPDESLRHIVALLGCYAGLLLLAARFAGINRKMLSSELATVRAMLKI